MFLTSYDMYSIEKLRISNDDITNIKIAIS